MAMDDQVLLSKVKELLMITGEEFDATLKLHMLAAKNYMVGAGVPNEAIYSDAGVVAIGIGANDLWNLSAGAAEFSPVFTNMILQLRHATADDSEGVSG